jgi:DNA-binding NtrC family response regulator
MVKNETVARRQHKLRGEPTPSRARRILVVEDDGEVSQALAQTLKLLGCVPVSCGGALEALHQIRTQPFDLMLVDYRMPDITGLDLILLLRHDHYQVPIIMITGYSSTEARVSSEQLGNFMLLKKPFNSSQLAEAMEGLLEGVAGR